MSFMFSQELTACIIDEESQYQSDSDHISQETLRMVSDPHLPPNNWASTMTGRTQPRPPTWIHSSRPPVNLHQRRENREASRAKPNYYTTSQGDREGAGGGRWKFNRFGSRQDAGGRVSGASAARERDLQGHLKELANKMDRLPSSMLKLLEESVKYLEARHKSNDEKMPNQFLERSRDLVAHKPSSDDILQNLSGRLSEFEKILKDEVENNEKLEQTREEVERNMSDIVHGFHDNSIMLKSIEVLTHDMRRSLEQTKNKSHLSAVVPSSRLPSTPSAGLMEQDDPPLVRRASSALPGNLSLTQRFQQLNLVDGEERTLLDTTESMEDEEWWDDDPIALYQ